MSQHGGHSYCHQLQEAAEHWVVVWAENVFDDVCLEKPELRQIDRFVAVINFQLANGERACAQLMKARAHSVQLVEVAGQSHKRLVTFSWSLNRSGHCGRLRVL